MAGLSPLDLIRWQRQVRLDPETTRGEVLLACVLVERHNSTTGLTCPSIRTLARESRQSGESVIAAYRGLAERGHLRRIHRRSYSHTRDLMSNSYVLILKAAPIAPETAPRRGVPVEPMPAIQAGGVFVSDEQGCSFQPEQGVRLGGTERSEENASENNGQPDEISPGTLYEDLTPAELEELAVPDAPTPIVEAQAEGTPPKTPAPADVPIHEIMALPPSQAQAALDRTTRRLQQLAGPPGYRMGSAAVDTGKAIRRSGLAEVEGLIARLEATHKGTLRVHSIRAYLDALPERSRGQNGQPQRGPLDDARAEAVRIYEVHRPGRGVVDFAGRRKIEAAITATGEKVPAWPAAAAMIEAIATAIRQGWTPH